MTTVASICLASALAILMAVTALASSHKRARVMAFSDAAKASSLDCMALNTIIVERAEFGRPSSSPSPNSGSNIAIPSPAFPLSPPVPVGLPTLPAYDMVSWGIPATQGALLPNVSGVASGNGHVLLLSSSGAVTASGQDNQFNQQEVPAVAAAEGAVRAVAAGLYHSLALLAAGNGTVVAWGGGSGGQLEVTFGPGWGG
jgi:hypothetical protein